MEPVAQLLASGEMATATTQPAWPVSEHTCWSAGRGIDRVVTQQQTMRKRGEVRQSVLHSANLKKKTRHQD